MGRYKNKRQSVCGRDRDKYDDLNERHEDKYRLDPRMTSKESCFEHTQSRFLF